MLVLADGGIETRIIYEFKRPLENFEAFRLLDDDEGRRILRAIYSSYAQVAARHDLPIQLGTPTWRASAKFTPDADRLNRAAFELLRGIAGEHPNARIRIAGVIGPAADGYAPAQALSEEDARAYHEPQARVLAECGVDVLYAPTFPAYGELAGAAMAMAQTGKPYALAPMLHPDGTMLDGTPLGEAIRGIDERVSPAPEQYFIGCLYPTHAQSALEVTRANYPQQAVRVRGLKANASPLSPEELDRLGRLDARSPQEFARDEWACAREFGLTTLGGCCGTDARDIEAIAAYARRAAETS